MLDLFERRRKLTNLLLCFIGLLISVAIVLTAVFCIFSPPNTLLSKKTWVGSGKVLNTDFKLTPDMPTKFSMALTIKTINQTKKSWDGILSENIYPSPIVVNGIFNGSSITFSTDLGFTYSGTLSGTAIEGVWFYYGNSKYNGSFSLKTT